MPFYIGQKVICIRTDWFLNNERYTGPQPVFRGKYTVRSYLDREHASDEHPYIRLYEIILPLNKKGIEPAFFEGGFKPLDERETDISVFTAMLQGEPVGAKELEYGGEAGGGLVKAGGRPLR